MNQFIRRNSSLVDVDFARVLRSETRAPLEGAESFGCQPFGPDYLCDMNCRYRGYSGGYCAWKVGCRCY